MQSYSINFPSLICCLIHSDFCLDTVNKFLYSEDISGLLSLKNYATSEFNLVNTCSIVLPYNSVIGVLDEKRLLPSFIISLEENILLKF
jgi:hypothetical protein